MGKEKLAEACVECGRCKEKCEFLNKYNMDLKKFEETREDQAFGCFLCGECKGECPKGIDGRRVALAIRKKSVQDGRFRSIAYLSTILEKKNYLFKNYRNGKKKRVLFPGCNFPSFYPETTMALVSKIRDVTDIGVIFDCCGKPIYELGLTEAADKLIKDMEVRLTEMGVEEIVTLCPNCYYFLKDKLNVKVTDIYKLLCELGVGSPPEVNGMNIFTPCPDRRERLIRDSLDSFLTASEINEITDVQCCGLGGHGGVTEPELSKGFINKLKEKNLKNLFTYCATCCGNFSRNDIGGVKHILCEIIKSDEAPAKGLNSLLNRASFKFWQAASKKMLT